jgi:hypothetical protein
VDRLVTQLLDALATQTPPVDLHQALAVPLPVLVIGELLGVPPEDRTRFRASSQAAAAVGGRERSQAGLLDLWNYTRQLVTDKRAQPGDDVISGLCTAEDGALDDDYIAMLAAMILFAGHETTVVQIDYGGVLLLTNPDQRQAVLNDPSLLPAAVEECLRAGNTGGGGIPRYPRADIEIAGVTIPAGDLVLLDIGAGNHDEAAFADPHRCESAADAAFHAHVTSVRAAARRRRRLRVPGRPPHRPQPSWRRQASLPTVRSSVSTVGWRSPTAGEPQAASERIDRVDRLNVAGGRRPGGTRHLDAAQQPPVRFGGG